MRSNKGWIMPLVALTGAAFLPGTVAAQAQETGGETRAAVDSILSGASAALRVDGMVCEFCALTLERHLKAIPSIDTLVVRVSDGLVLIRTKDQERIDDEALRSTVKQAGFVLRSVHEVKWPG